MYNSCHMYPACAENCGCRIGQAICNLFAVSNFGCYTCRCPYCGERYATQTQSGCDACSEAYYVHQFALNGSDSRTRNCCGFGRYTD